MTNPSVFPVTRWTAVLHLKERPDGNEGQAALSALCEDYWYPLYAFARRSGKSAHDAQDVTQGFFWYVVKKNLFASADPNLGRMRTFLLQAFRRYLTGQYYRESAQKRGGGMVICSLDHVDGEDRYATEPVDELTPEAVFENAWAHTVIANSMKKLEALESAAGRGTLFRELSVFLALDGHDPGASLQAAKNLGASEGAVRQNILRLRRRFRDLLRQEVAETLQEPTRELVDDEIQALKAAIIAHVTRGSL